MKKKLQVFISSTYTDLIEERQASVEAVLSSGHIPAGMELFKAGDESQKETIKKWINESDAYLLILGGRYGSIEPISGKSYTHWEYDYAGEIGIPRFAVVMDDNLIHEKVKELGVNAVEVENKSKYDDFRKLVLSKTSEFFTDLKDIKLTIFRKLAELASNDNLSGWVSAKDIKSSETLLKELTKLTQENGRLKDKLRELESHLDKRIKETGNKTSDSISTQYKDTKVRAERIFAVLNLKKQEDYDDITWIDGDGDGDGDGEVEVTLPEPRENFDVYFKYLEDDFIDSVWITWENHSYLQSPKDALAEIRIMLAELKDKEKDIAATEMKIKYLLIVKGEHSEFIKTAKEFFKKVLDIEGFQNQDWFELEVWDDSLLKQQEESLLLVI